MLFGIPNDLLYPFSFFANPTDRSPLHLKVDSSLWLWVVLSIQEEVWYSLNHLYPNET